MRIYIRPDGSIDPPSSHIHLINNTYCFVANITKNLYIQKSNITVDGNGYYLESISSETRGNPQSHLTNLSNVTITNINTTKHCTITLDNSSYCTITNNSISLNLQSSQNNTIKNNLISSINLQNSNYNTISNNQNYTITLLNSNYNQILNNTLTLGSQALEIDDSYNNLIYQNYFSLPCHRWLRLEGNSQNNQFVANQIQGPFVLEPIIKSKNNLFVYNNFIDAFQAKFPDSENTIQQNNISNNYYNTYKGADNNNEGIGDEPNTIKNQFTDN